MGGEAGRASRAPLTDTECPPLRTGNDASEISPVRPANSYRLRGTADEVGLDVPRADVFPSAPSSHQQRGLKDLRESAVANQAGRSCPDDRASDIRGANDSATRG